MKRKTLFLASALLLSLVSCGGQSSTGGGGGNADYYVITFNFNDSSSRPYAKEVEKGSALDKGPTPQREGYDFLGWYTAVDGGTKVTFPYTASDNVALYAHWDAAKFDVTFDLNYAGAPASSVVKVAYNETVSAPAQAPTRDHYVFRYWTMDAEGTQQAEFPYLVKKNTTFYASWRDDATKVFAVTVHYGSYEGAPADKVLQIEEGNAITRQLLPDPTGPSGYAFKGWSLTDGGSVITLPYTPTSDMDLYAVWERTSYTLKFYYNYVDAPASIYSQTTYYGGDNFSAPTTDPSRPGYAFDGWWTAEKGGSKVTFPTTGYRNLSYYAHWVSDPVVTDIFHAEYCYFDPNANYPGYSGAAKGDECIIRTGAEGALVDNYPTNSVRPAGNAFAVSFQYSNSAIIHFEITASEAISGASMSINWSSEFDQAYGPSSDAVYQIRVNDVAVNYPVTELFADEQQAVTPGPFVLTVLGNVNLKQGLNIIELQPNNEIVHGTMQATAPVTDYIKFDYSGSGKLSWKPVYDNLNNK